MEKWYIKLPRYTNVGQIFLKNSGCRTKHIESYIKYVHTCDVNAT